MKAQHEAALLQYQTERVELRATIKAEKAEKPAA
jgi:hypothetical protein